MRLTGAGDAPDVEGRLVDVSAGGIRLASAARPGLKPGQAVHVEIRVGPGPAEFPPPVRLAGRGFVTRLGRSGDGAHETAVCFEAPLAIRDVFPALSAYGPGGSTHVA